MITWSVNSLFHNWIFLGWMNHNLGSSNSGINYFKIGSLLKQFISSWWTILSLYLCICAACWKLGIAQEVLNSNEQVMSFCMPSAWIFLLGVLFSEFNIYRLIITCMYAYCIICLTNLENIHKYPNWKIYMEVNLET